MVQATGTARLARGWTCCWPECDRSGCARGRKTCMLGAGPPRDGIIRTSPGQECSKDKGALPGARRIFVYAARFWSTAGPASTVWFKPYHLVLHLDEKRVSLYPAKRRSARSSMDRASDYGSEGWGFESLRARSGPPRCDPPVGVLHFYQALLRECFFHAHPLVVVPASRFSVRSEVTSAQQRAYLSGGATELAQHSPFRSCSAKKLRPARPLQRCFREKTRPARHKTPIFGHFSRAGRILSRSGRQQAEQGELFRAQTAVTWRR